MLPNQVRLCLVKTPDAPILFQAAVFGRGLDCARHLLGVAAPIEIVRAADGTMYREAPRELIEKLARSDMKTGPLCQWEHTYLFEPFPGDLVEHARKAIAEECRMFVALEM